jgi:WD40 repeat protein
MVWVWDIQSGKAVIHFRVSTKDDAVEYVIPSIAFSADGKRIATSATSSLVQVWDIATGKLALPTLSQHIEGVWCVAFSPDGRFLVSTGRDRSAILWNAESGDVQATLLGHQHEVRWASFSPDGIYIATASHDHTIRIWNVATATCIGTLSGHQSGITCVTFSPDSSQLVSCAWDHTIRFWNLDSMRPTCDPWQGSDLNMQSIAYSPDGHWIAVADEKGKIQILDALTGCVGEEISLSGRICCLAFTPDGGSIAVASDEDSIAIYAMNVS